MTAVSQSTVETGIYSEMGLVPVINARGNQTLFGGSILSPEIREAMDAANRYFVSMEDLFAETGKMVAELLECEAAYITSGCAAALVLGTAACIAGDDVAKIRALPHTQGMRNKVLIQGPHRYKYEHVTTIVGTKLIEVGDADSVSAEQLDAALGSDTAAVLFPAHLDSARGIVPLEEVIEIAHRNGVAVLVDAASQLYPLERMLGWTKMGADLVCFGAKYFGAPHSSGILCGRRDLVESAVSQGFIGFETGASAFGRPAQAGPRGDHRCLASAQELDDARPRAANRRRSDQTGPHRRGTGRAGRREIERGARNKYRSAGPLCGF